MKVERAMRIEQSEAEFMRAVTDAAELSGWSWLHIERMGNDRGQWRTPASGPLGTGWPDLVLLKRGRLLFFELKSQRGVLTQFQRERLQELSTVGDCYVLRPSDFPLILEILNRA